MGATWSTVNIRSIIDMNKDGLNDIVLVYKEKAFPTVVAINNGNKSFSVYSLSTS